MNLLLKRIRSIYAYYERKQAQKQAQGLLNSLSYQYKCLVFVLIAKPMAMNKRLKIFRQIFRTQNKNRTHFQAGKCFQAQFISQAQFLNSAEHVQREISFRQSILKLFHRWLKVLFSLKM